MVHQHTLILTPTQSGVENVGGVAKIVFYIRFFFVLCICCAVQGELIRGTVGWWLAEQ